MKHKMQIVVMLILIAFSFNNISYAGMLDDFETSATKKKPKSENRNSTKSCQYKKRCNNSSDSFAELFVEMFAEMIGAVIRAGAQGTSARTKMYKSSNYFEPRKIGSPLLPTLRLDLSSQSISPNIQGNDFRIEVGESTTAVQFRATKYKENSPTDSMDYVSAHGLYRLAFGNHVNFNLGVGASFLSGNKKTSGLSLTFPFYWHFHENMGIEYKPVITSFNKNIVTDQDLSVLFNYKAASIAVGYRKLSSVGEALSGPYIGFSLRR